MVRNGVFPLDRGCQNLILLPNPLSRRHVLGVPENRPCAVWKIVPHEIVVPRGGML
jgi:hypothetical protein